MADTVNVLSTDLRAKVHRDVDIIPGAWVEFYDDVTVGAIEAAAGSKEAGTMGPMLDQLVAQIADWNFAGPDSVKLPVTRESISKLSTKLLMWMTKTQAEILAQLGDEAKKKA